MYICIWVSVTVMSSHLVLGYCCINVELRAVGIFCSRTCRLQTIQERGINYSYELAKKNLEDLACILRWNHKNDIKLYRMSSEMFPFATHPDYRQKYDLGIFKDDLQNIGRLAREYGQTLTFHPGQYNQLSSHRDSVIESAICDIDFHAAVMDMMGLDKDSVIVIHGGCKRDGKDASLGRLKTNFKQLSPSSQKRLVLENCELVYSVEDLLPVCNELSVPLVLDFHHHNLNPGTKPLIQLMSLVLETWNKRGITPLFHVSESRTGVTENDSITARRAHSDYVTNLPKELLQAEQRINLDVEAKMKEQAVIFLFQKFNLSDLF